MNAPDAPPPSAEDRLARIETQLGALGDQVDRLRRFLEAAPGLRTVPLGEHVAMVRLNSGRRMLVDTRDLLVAQHLMLHGIWEPQFLPLVRRTIRPGHVCVDAGANYGYYSLLFAQLAGPQGQVLAFEPNPVVFALLERTLAANGHRPPARGSARAHQIALGAASGEAVLHFSRESYGGGTVSAPGTPRPAQGDVAQVAVKVAALDQFPIDTRRPLFLKIDTEGGEYDVFRGARTTIAAAAEVAALIEFHPEAVERHLPVPDYLAFLRGLGFTIHAIEHGQPVKAGDDALIGRGNAYLFLTKGPTGA